MLDETQGASSFDTDIISRLADDEIIALEEIIDSIDYLIDVASTYVMVGVPLFLFFIHKLYQQRRIRNMQSELN